MALMWWEKGLWQICMHHCTVHEKVDFPKFPSDIRIWGVCSTEWACSQDLTLFPFYCMHHHRSFWRKTNKSNKANTLGPGNYDSFAIAILSWNHQKINITESILANRSHNQGGFPNLCHIGGHIVPDPVTLHFFTGSFC